MDDQPAPRPAPRPAPPEPGMPRHVVSPAGDSLGIEVWTGEGWVELVGVALVTTPRPVTAPVLQQATVILSRVLPADRLTLPRRPVAP
jgi:hypothetical protein